MNSAKHIAREGPPAAVVLVDEAGAEGGGHRWRSLGRRERASSSVARWTGERSAAQASRPCEPGGVDAIDRASRPSAVRPTRLMRRSCSSSRRSTSPRCSRPSTVRRRVGERQAELLGELLDRDLLVALHRGCGASSAGSSRGRPRPAGDTGRASIPTRICRQRSSMAAARASAVASVAASLACMHASITPTQRVRKRTQCALRHRTGGCGYRCVKAVSWSAVRRNVSALASNA